MQVAQSVWRWKIAAYLFLAGVGAGSYIMGTVLDWAGFETASRLGIWIGVPAVMLSTLFLFSDLGHPERFFSAFLNAGQSWISRGSIIITLYTGVGIISLLTALAGIDPGTQRTIQTIGAVLAVGVAMYTGLLIGVVGSRPFWNSPLLPLLFLVSALSTGIGAIFVGTIVWYGINGRIGEAVETLGRLDVLLIVLEMLVVYLYLAISVKRAAASVDLLTRGALSALFWGGFIVVGLVVPLVLEYIALAVSGEMERIIATAVAGVFLLVGGLILRFLVLGAGIRVPMYVRVPIHVRPRA